MESGLKRLEIWTAAGGPDYASKPRPVIILQDERIPTGSVTICGLTSDSAEAPFYRPDVQGGERTGLREPSRAMVDKITTLPRRKLRQRIGALSTDEAAEVRQAIFLFLGFHA
jgi:mRNA interferase MazF